MIGNLNRSSRFIALAAVVTAAIVYVSSFPSSAAPSTAVQTADTPRIKFKRISIEDGLSQSIVECIIQDKTGFLWLGTESGLNKYDGYDFTVMVNDPKDPNSLSYNHILSVCEDSHGYLWIGTFHGGLNRYDPETGIFKLYINDPRNSSSISHNNINAILEDRSGTLWIGTDDGLNRFDPVSDSFSRFLDSSKSSTSPGGSAVLDIYEDDEGMLWIAQDGNGLCCVDTHGILMRHYLHDPGDDSSLSSNSVRSIFQDRSETFWVGTVGGGLNRLDDSRKHFSRYRHDPHDPSSLSNDNVYAIYEDSFGSLWIGTKGGGLNLYDRGNDGFFHYLNDPNDPTSIGYNEIYDIFEDRSGVIWLGTYGDGTSSFHGKLSKFNVYRPDPTDPEALNEGIVWSILEDTDKTLWIGTHGGGLNHFDRKSGRFTHFRNDHDDPESINSDIVRIVFMDRNKTIWVGTRDGIGRFNRKTGKFSRYTHDPGDPSSISHNEIRSIYEDRKGTMWIGTYGGGLNSFDRESGKFQTFRHDIDDSTSLSNDFVREMLEDSAGRFWIGTQGGGLELMNRARGTFTHFRTDISDPQSLNNDYAFTILEGEGRTLWIGTMGGGLNRLDINTGKFRHFTEDDGLANNSVYCILGGNDGKLWMSSNFGISSFDPETEEFSNYNSEDGIQSNEFNGGSSFKSSSGELFFGNIDGFISFFPDRIVNNPNIPPVVLTTFKKLNKSVDLDRPIARIDELVLSHKDYFFSFEFSALDYYAPGKNKYAYMMEGLDKDWIYTDSSKRIATYTTLQPGKYIFRVKGSNNDGIWNEEGVSIKITITPPFWKTLWFRALIGLIIAAIIFILYNRRVKNVRISTELMAAQAAQMSIMPHKDPQIDGFDISGTCIPANEVGGDFYDYMWLDIEKTRFLVAIGDVSGKAMKAAMIAVMSSGMICSRAMGNSSISKIMTEINPPLFSKTEATMYTALFLAAIDIKTKEIAFSNAGFSDPILKTAESLMKIDNVGSRLPLGMLEDTSYSEKKVRMEHNDILVLFSDGVPDAINQSKEFYDTDSLETLLKDRVTPSMSAREIKELIVDDVMRFAGHTPQNDDITLVVIKAC
ncbi:MAG: SpoIIE family protein phosphatase [Candidatus Krumholzibacteriota bacterium]|nr:SpoIIE family protein phosphatase [Candidatus Krumholzibacteriota bacterium]